MSRTLSYWSEILSKVEIPSTIRIGHVTYGTWAFSGIYMLTTTLTKGLIKREDKKIPRIRTCLQLLRYLANTLVSRALENVVVDVNQYVTCHWCANSSVCKVSKWHYKTSYNRTIVTPIIVEQESLYLRFYVKI